MNNNIVKIEFPLPFHIPIEDGLKIITDYKDFATFKFECKEYKNESFKSRPEIEEFCTNIHMEFLSYTSSENATVEELMRQAVFNSIIYLNNFLDSFRLIADLNFIRNFSITDLPPIINIQVGEQELLYITTPTTIVNNPKPLNAESLKYIQNRISAWDRNRYFEVIDKFLSKAIHHLYTEEFLFAIIELQTSFESYIRMCHNLILIKDGESEEKIEKAKNYPFKNTIIDHIGKALDENLDFEDNPVINKWYEKLYSLRNKIVHSGQSYISGDMAYDAFDALDENINYINDLMVSKNYMELGGTVKIEELNRNTPEHVDSKEVEKRLRDRGFLE
ncbi:hypothetical protein [Olleya namhaensis]|uniref:hypothetical protein n=1 Tax=Olleya namhaensis TaxID=1144750 RepID=UPI002491BD0E|nr:hypothetical protein [Olleya namhaensis]